jgi:ferredoxin
VSNTVVVNRLIIPPEEAIKLVSQAGAVYLQDCSCRSQMKKCPKDKWEVCLLFEHASEEERLQARLISTEEAIQIVRMTTERGDIHQVFYFQDGERPYELCNCCTCCCYPLREEKEKGNNYEDQLRCGYITITDPSLCNECGQCIASCFFEARQLEIDGLHLIEDLCFGCGRCIPNCPEGAIRLEYHPERGIPIPVLRP